MCKVNGAPVVCIDVIVMEVHAILKRVYAIVHLAEQEFDVNKVFEHKIKRNMKSICLFYRLSNEYIRTRV